MRQSVAMLQGRLVFRSWGRMLHFRAGSDLLFPPFLLWVTHWLRLGEIFEMWSSITTSQQGEMLAREEPHHDPSSAATRSTQGTFTACFLVPCPCVPSRHSIREQTREGKGSGECRGVVRRDSWGRGGNCANTVSSNLAPR